MSGISENRPPDLVQAIKEVTSLCKAGFYGEVSLNLKDGKIKTMDITKKIKISQ